MDLQKTITKAVLLQIEAILGIQHASNLSQRIPMALAVTNLPGFEFYDVLKLNTPNPGYLILTPKIPISTSKPYIGSDSACLELSARPLEHILCPYPIFLQIF